MIPFIRSPELSIIVPTFNERPNVPLLVNKLRATLTGIEWEVIFVDDNSTNGTIDLKLSGQVERYFWSLSVNNVLNALYYDYAIASTFTDGRFSAYPLPGRSYLLKAGATF